MTPGPCLAAAGIAALVLFAGCTCPRSASRGDDVTGASPSATRARPLRTLGEARAAIGHRVRVEGIARREKLGDSVDAAGLVLTCLDFRFEDERIGRTVTVEGVLDETRDFEAVRGPRGEISQGTESDAALLVLRGCESRHGPD